MKLTISAITIFTIGLLSASFSQAESILNFYSKHQHYDLPIEVHLHRLQPDKFNPLFSSLVKQSLSEEIRNDEAACVARLISAIGPKTSFLKSAGYDVLLIEVYESLLSSSPTDAFSDFARMQKMSLSKWRGIPVSVDRMCGSLASVDMAAERLKSYFRIDHIALTAAISVKSDCRNLDAVLKRFSTLTNRVEKEKNRQTMIHLHNRRAESGDGDACG